ncbi:MAG: bifunctional (p)ppGpp synthetase/guanosine-3',5'-bis(diphosphate) 3'-pyrophosphohydrolase [Clostridia bacterium]|nr:bifunctional (p)ppGpp synthetase/guanosine-3',5'-bis(diphosphate) 3'-pyrophosphohydrolase [Clostridia bacterium]
MIKDTQKRYCEALAFAEKKHAGQFRVGGDPYITHPVAVAEIVRGWGYGTSYQIAALFHDLLEDTDATEQEICAIGGRRVARAVRRLTKVKPYTMASYIAGIRQSKIARVVKAADRLHNLRCATVTSESFKRRYVTETIEWFLDFSSEILPATRALAATMQEHLDDYPVLYDDMD